MCSAATQIQPASLRNVLANRSFDNSPRITLIPNKLDISKSMDSLEKQKRWHENCMASSLPEPQYEDFVTFSSAVLRSDCSYCKVLVKVCAPVNKEDEEEHWKACEFWSSVRNYANSLYWSALDNDANTDYPITNIICKGAILDHHIMRKCNSKI